MEYLICLYMNSLQLHNLYNILWIAYQDLFRIVSQQVLAWVVEGWVGVGQAFVVLVLGIPTPEDSLYPTIRACSSLMYPYVFGVLTAYTLHRLAFFLYSLLNL